MNVTIWQSTRCRRVAAGIGVALAVVLAAGRIGIAHGTQSRSGHALSGTWFVEVTLRNCANQAPLGSFNSLVTFHADGTMSEATSSATFAIGQRSPGHGNWAAEGHQTYAQHMVNLINFDTPANLPGTPGFNPSLPISPGFFAGWGTVIHTVQLSDADHLTSSGTNEFYKSGETTPYRTGCSTALATRFE